MSSDARPFAPQRGSRPGEPALRTRTVSTSWHKDYDAVPDNDPASWPTRFDIRQWIFLSAWAGTERVGGAIAVADPTAVALTGGRPTAAVLWDLRVAPAFRRRGVGRQLLSTAEAAVRAERFRALDVETQDINVAACRLYSECGYDLIAVIRDAYPDARGEAKLVWSKRLVSELEDRLTDVENSSPRSMHE